MTRRSFFRACAGAAVAAPLASLAPALPSPFTFPAHAVIPRYVHQNLGLSFKVTSSMARDGAVVILKLSDHSIDWSGVFGRGT